MTQFAEFAKRDHRSAVEIRFESAQLVGRLAEAAKLLAKRFDRQRVLRRLGQRLRRLETTHGPSRGGGNHAERTSHERMHHEIQRHAAL